MSYRGKDVSGYGQPQELAVSTGIVVNNNDKHQKSRFQVRIEGHEDDIMRNPDKTLQWFSALVPDGVNGGQGTNPRYQPGEEVVCMRLPGSEEWVIIGSKRREDPYEGEEADVNPYTLDGNESEKSPPPQRKERNTGWDITPTEKGGEGGGTTKLARKYRRKREQSKKVQGEEETRPEEGSNTKRNRIRYAGAGWASDYLSIAKDLEFDDTQDPSKFIEKKIQNKGAAIPEILNMVQNLKKVDDKNNPEATQAVGAGNYGNFLGQLAGLFSGLQQQSQQQQQQSQEEEEKEQEQQRQRDRAAELELLMAKGYLDANGNPTALAEADGVDTGRVQVEVNV